VNTRHRGHAARKTRAASQGRRPDGCAHQPPARLVCGNLPPTRPCSPMPWLLLIQPRDQPPRARHPQSWSCATDGRARDRRQRWLAAADRAHGRRRARSAIFLACSPEHVVTLRDQPLSMRWHPHLFSNGRAGGAGHGRKDFSSSCGAQPSSTFWLVYGRERGRALPSAECVPSPALCSPTWR
jgi:hypothetical protein